MIRLDHGTEVPLQRKASSSSFDDSRSATWPTVGSPRAWWKLDAPRLVITDNGKEYLQSGRLYVYRGTDIRAGDRVVLPEGVFGVVTPPELDYNHAMNNHDFGVMRVHIERGG